MKWKRRAAFGVVLGVLGIIAAIETYRGRLRDRASAPMHAAVASPDGSTRAEGVAGATKPKLPEGGQAGPVGRQVQRPAATAGAGAASDSGVERSGQRNVSRLQGNARPAAIVRTGVAAVVQKQFERTLDLFSSTVPMDEGTREHLMNALLGALRDDMEINRVGREKGLSYEETEKLRSDRIHELNQDIIDTVGTENGRYLLALDSAKRFFPITDDFAARCAKEGVPVNDAAFGAMTINFSRYLSNPHFPRPLITTPSGRPFTEVEALKAAEAILNPRQVAIFKQLWAEHPYPPDP